MARLYANENFPVEVVEHLRALGHDVLTTHDAGKSNQAIEGAGRGQVSYRTEPRRDISRNPRH